METIKTINIENGLKCDEALAQLQLEIEALSLTQTKILKVIHGYGSSGIGGIIKKEVQILLKTLKSQNKILNFVQNEKFGATSPLYQKYTKLFPSLILDSDLQNLNPGITLVFLQ